MTRRPFFAARGAALALALSLASGCATPGAAPAAQPTPAKIKVVATFSILGDMAANIGADKIELRTLVGPESDAHDYEPTPADSQTLAEADVILENGLEFESWLPALYTASRSKAKRTVVSEGVTTRTMTHDGATETDPHIWQSPENAVRMTANIAAALSAADAANAATYKANADAYAARLTELDKAIKDEVASLPADRRRLVTSHDALGYFAERYGFEVVGSVIDSLSTEAGEPSAAELAGIIDAIKKSGVKAIFLESMGNAALVERVAKESGVVVGPELYTDALGKAGSPGATYIDALRHNAREIVKALSAP